MKILLTKDKNRRNQYLLFEKKKIILKYIINNLNLPKNIRFSVYKRLSKLPKDASITKIRNRCALTNRPRGVYKKLRLSRIAFRNLALSGNLVGIKKAS
jgi:ribosomal protein S14